MAGQGAAAALHNGSNHQLQHQEQLSHWHGINPACSAAPLPACCLPCLYAGLMAVSLGYFDTLLSASAASTSSELSETELEAAGKPSCSTTLQRAWGALALAGAGSWWPALDCVGPWQFIMCCHKLHRVDPHCRHRRRAGPHERGADGHGGAAVGAAAGGVPPCGTKASHRHAAVQGGTGGSFRSGHSRAFRACGGRPAKDRACTDSGTMAALPLRLRHAAPVQVTRDAATGELKRTPSWHSFGSTADSDEGEEEEGDAEEDCGGGTEGAAPAAVSAAGAAGAAGSGGGSSGKAPSVRVRRVSTCTEVVYTPVQPAVP